MNGILKSRQVGPYSMNTYAVIDPGTQKAIIVDPGGEPESVLELVSGMDVEKILITHGHHDHVLFLEEVKAATKAPVYIHPEDADKFSLKFDLPLKDGLTLSVGNLFLIAIHVPGHTPGQCCFNLGDGRILVGDTIFVGGPGKTDSYEDFLTTMRSMHDIVFNWPDSTLFYPGHGSSGQIGIEKPDYESFVKNGWAFGVHGDITWK